MKFIVTKELGKLARWLRILGFDAVYYNSENTGSLIIEALREDRWIITRRRSKIDDLEKRTVVIHSEDIKEQLSELRDKLSGQIDESKMFSRCIICNKLLKEEKKENLQNRVPEYVFQTQKNFMICPECKRVYWQGSHWGNIKETLEEVWQKKEFFHD